jgi:hypothetical protein
MKLHELKFPSSKEGAGAILFKNGYNRVGKGRFSSVYRKGNDKSVIKLYLQDDFAYSDYVDFCRIHSASNPHFPKFSKSAINIPGTDYNAVRTEALTEMPSMGLAWANAIIGYFKKTLTPEEEETWISEQPESFQDACILLRQWITESGYTSDVTPRNLMRRGDTIVFTDPVVWVKPA